MRITRTAYLNKLIAFKDKQLIKVVTGIRRCGKSVLMEMYQDWLLQNGVEQGQIIAINFNLSIISSSSVSQSASGMVLSSLFAACRMAFRFISVSA